MKIGSEAKHLTLTPETLAELCKDMQQADKDLTVLVTGYKGCGKSSAIIETTLAATGEEFSFENNILLTPDGKAIADHIEASGRFPFISLDEAIGSLYREQWTSAVQQALHKYLQQFQRKDKNCILFLCIPSPHDLRGPLMRAGINLWVHLYEERGHGVVMMKSPCPTMDPFYLDKLDKLWNEEAGKSRTNVINQYEVKFQNHCYSKMPTFLAFFEFPAPPAKLYGQYLKYVRENRDNIITQIYNESDEEKVKEEYKTVRKKFMLEKMKEALAEKAAGIDGEMAKTKKHDAAIWRRNTKKN